MDTAGNTPHGGTNPPQTGKASSIAALGGLLAFATLFLGHLLGDPCGSYHHELCSELDRTLEPGRRLVGALPREHAKTTLGTVALVIRELCTGTKKNILLVAANREEASTKLRQIVGELEDNEKLKDEFGQRIAPALDSKNQRVSYSDNEIVLSGGARVAVLGFGGKVRGQLSGGRRLDLVVLDDPEDDQAVASPQRRVKMRRWVDLALLNALDLERGSLIWLGTLLHHDSVLAQWTKAHEEHENWRVINKPALNDHNEPLWPGRWTLARLNTRREEIGERAFAQEYLNRPVSEGEQVFKPEEFGRYDQLRIVKRGNECYYGPDRLSVVIGVDPAIGEGEQHDYFAAIVLGIAQDSRIFVLDIARVKKRFPDQLKLLENLAECWSPVLIGVESVCYQTALAQMAVERGLPVKELKASQPKAVRINVAAVHAARGRLHLPANTTWLEDFISEAADYPAGAHDDQLDALARALEIGMPLAGSSGSPIDTAPSQRNAVRGFSD